MKRKPNGCASCGRTDLVPAVDNHGHAYMGCPSCRIGVSCAAPDQTIIEQALAEWADGGLAASTTLGGAFRDGFTRGVASVLRAQAAAKDRGGR